jgi:hypothetical protein
MSDVTGREFMAGLAASMTAGKLAGDSVLATDAARRRPKPLGAMHHNRKQTSSIFALLHGKR